MSSRCMVSNININHSNRLDKCELATAETILLLDPFIAAPLCLAVYLHSSYICTTAPDAKYGYLCQMSVYMCANMTWYLGLYINIFFVVFNRGLIEISNLIERFYWYCKNLWRHYEQLSPLGIGTLVRKDIDLDLVFSSRCQNWGTLINRSCSLNKNLIKTKSRSENTRS